MGFPAPFLAHPRDINFSSVHQLRGIPSPGYTVRVLSYKEASISRGDRQRRIERSMRTGLYAATVFCRSASVSPRLPYHQRARATWGRRHPVTARTTTLLLFAPSICDVNQPLRLRQALTIVND